MKQSLIVGTDVSKETLDNCCMPTGNLFQIPNGPSGFIHWWENIKSLCSSDTEILVIMEHTGLYSCQFELFLQSKGIQYCKLPALEIKRSMGMVRGKDDKVDAERIAMYGWLRRHILQADQYPSESLSKLRALLSFRQKMVRDKTGYQSRLKEILNAGLFTQDDSFVQKHKQLISLLKEEIKAVEQRIREVIKSEDAFEKTYKLLIGVKGVGPIIASAMIGYTENFRKFSSARKFNCYAGLAPFKHRSGRSIKKKDRVSHLANKTIKALLSMGASTAVQHDQELKQYYQRRLAEGKQDGHCLNIIKAKLVARMFAVIKRQTPYQPIRIAG